MEENVLANLPDPFREKVRMQMNLLKELLEDRPPRFAIVGRRGSGKSSLINAIFGAEVAEVGSVRSTTRALRWYKYSNDRGEILILDTRGLGDGAGEDHELPAERELKQAIQERCPDAILFLSKAKEVDARIHEDLDSLVRIQKYASGESGIAPPVFGILTQVDELDPPDVCQPPYEDAVKKRNISRATALFGERLNARLKENTDILPVSAYMRFCEGVVCSDRRWNIDLLIEHLVERIPRSARMTLARIAQVRSVQESFARKIVVAAAALAAGIAATPIPAADLPFITAVQTLMIMGIASVGRGHADKRVVSEFLAAAGLNVGVAFIFREIARGLVKLLPVSGEVISATVAAAATKTLGEAAIKYFIRSETFAFGPLQAS